MRVLALTADPTLEAALNMMDDWDVVVVASVSEMPAGDGVLLIGVGAIGDGLEQADAARASGVGMPVVVVGDGEAIDSFAEVVTRPFSLDDLREAVDRAAAGVRSNGAGTTAVEPAPEPRQIPEPPKPAERPAGLDQPAPEPAPVAVEAEIPDFDLAEITVPPQREEEPPPLTVAPPAPAPTPAPIAEPEVASAPPPAPVAAPPAESRRARRKRGRKKPAVEPVRRDPVTAKLEHAARAAREIAALLDELPMLSDPQDMAGALVGEIRERFKPDVAAVYIRGRDRFMIAANHGLSKTEAKMELALDHAILTELGSDPEALLIAPVDLARGLVSGIAGARTDALLVGPVTVEGRIVGLITVGRGDFNDEELDILDELSREAAPGLAIAELLARLGGRPNDED